MDTCEKFDFFSILLIPNSSFFQIIRFFFEFEGNLLPFYGIKRCKEQFKVINLLKHFTMKNFDYLTVEVLSNEELASVKGGYGIPVPVLIPE